MITILPKSINTIEEAKKLLTDLSNNGESYHPEDDANDCLKGIVTTEEGDLLNDLMSDIYNLEGNNGNHANPVFCPCEFLLSLEPVHQEVKLSFKVGDYVGYYLTDKCLFKGTIDSIDTDQKNKPYVIKAEDGSTKFAHEEFLKMEFKSTFETYKGYKIELPNPAEGKSHSAFIYDGSDKLVKCIAGDIAEDGSNNRLDKSKSYIDSLIFF